MGSSKVIMLSGVYLIFGFYTVAFNNADESMFKTSTKTAALAQEEQMAQTGLSLASGYMSNDPSRNVFATRTFVSGNNTVRYSATHPASFPVSQTQVTSVASRSTVVGGVVKETQVVTQTAVYQFHNGRWKQVRVFTTRNYQDSF
ncbi:MAG: hypothetical protein WCI84_01900 [Bacteroidota bacterium]